MPANSSYTNSKVDGEFMEAADLEAVEQGFYDVEQGTLKKTNNLSDLADDATARTNLGVAIGVNVQAYDADTAKYDDVTANFTGTLQNGGSNVVVDTDIGSTVEAYDATILKSADIGTTVQGYDVDTAKYDAVTANFTGTLQNGGSNVLVDTDIGVTVEGVDADILRADTSDNLVVGYTTDVETLGSNTITPSLTTEWLKSRAVNGNVTINEPTDGSYGGCLILLTTDASGPYTVTLGTGVSSVGNIPDLEASTSYEVKVVKHSNSLTTVEIAEIV